MIHPQPLPLGGDDGGGGGGADAGERNKKQETRYIGSSPIRSIDFQDFAFLFSPLGLPLIPRTHLCTRSHRSLDF